MHRTAQIFRTCSVEGKVSIYIIFSGSCQKSISANVTLIPQILNLRLRFKQQLFLDNMLF